jgi:hypothetical protein
MTVGRVILKKQMQTITSTKKRKIVSYLENHHIPAGLGTEEEACSIAAINLALSGKLTDEIPECMSAVIGHWIVVLQDAMPDEMRNSKEWKELLPFAAGTGREKEAERLAILRDHLWETVLPALQSMADAKKVGTEWQEMCKHRAWVTDVKHKLYKADWWELDAALCTLTELVLTPMPEATQAREIAKITLSIARIFDGKVTSRFVNDSPPSENEKRVWDTFDPCALLRKLLTADSVKVYRIYVKENGQARDLGLRCTRQQAITIARDFAHSSPEKTYYTRRVR